MVKTIDDIAPELLARYGHSLESDNQRILYLGTEVGGEAYGWTVKGINDSGLQRAILIDRHVREGRRERNPFFVGPSREVDTLMCSVFIIDAYGQRPTSSWSGVQDATTEKLLASRPFELFGKTIGLCGDELDYLFEDSADRSTTFGSHTFDINSGLYQRIEDLRQVGVQVHAVVNSPSIKLVMAFGERIGIVDHNGASNTCSLVLADPRVVKNEEEYKRLFNYLRGLIDHANAV